MKHERAEKVLNELAKSYFINSCGVSFKVLMTLQIEVYVSSFSKRMVTKQKDSVELIQKLDGQGDVRDLSLLFEFLVNSPSTKTFDWEDYLLEPIEISDSVKDEAKLKLREHAEQFVSDYVEPLQKMIHRYPGKSEFLFEVWEESFKKQAKHLKKIDKISDKIMVRQTRKGFCPCFETSFAKVEFQRVGEEVSFKIEEKEECGLIKETIKVFPCFLSLIWLYEQLRPKVLKLKKDYLKKISENHQMKKYSTVYSCREEFSSRFNLEIQFDKNRFIIGPYPLMVDLKSVPESQWLPMFEMEIKEIAETLRSEIEKTFNFKVRQLEEAGKDEAVEPILSVIEQSPKKGITTYIDILKGDDTAKIKDNHYHQLKAYGKLSELTKIKIRSKIVTLLEQDYVDCLSFKASFGRYEGYVLTAKGKQVLACLDNVIKEPKVIEYPEMKTWSDFESAFLTYDLERHFKGLLEKFVQEAVLEIKDLPLLVEFILNKRKIYREEESYFIQSIATLIPTQGKDFFKMMAQFETGKGKETLLAICEATGS